MKISLSLIRQFLEIDVSNEQIADAFVSLGIEVDSIEQSTPTFSQVIVGKIHSVHPHPHADRLYVVEVFDGKALHQVVCGANNCRKNMLCPFAPIGATLQDENFKKFSLRKTKLRDIESFGMLLTAKELHLFNEEDKILELPEDSIVGSDISQFLDPVFEVSLTPNLGHCMSALGLARELSAFFKKKIKKQKLSIESAIQNNVNTAQISYPEDCSRYSHRIIQHVQVAPSPFWLKKQLMQCGVRSINNIVDITNLVLLETGQPIHAFDLQKIEGDIEITRAKKKDLFIGIDEVERELNEHCIVVKDKKKILALAGIMGGQSSCVDNTTTHILLEVACFNPIKIRKTCHALNLHTESSHRFEKNIDFEIDKFAMDRVSVLILQLANGDLSPIKEKKCTPFLEKKILLRSDKVNQLLGTKLSYSEIKNILERLDFFIEKEKPNSFEVIVPSFRNDIHQEVDLIEEIARIYGYNHIQADAALYTSTKISHAPLYLFENHLRSFFKEQGLQEVLNCDLTNPEIAALDKETDFTLIKTKHAKSLDFSTLRPSLLFGILQNIQFNVDRKTSDLKLFEIGHVHFQKNDKFLEYAMCSIAITGIRDPLFWDNHSNLVNFFDLKGILENLTTSLSLPVFKYTSSKHPNFHPFRQANIFIEDLNIGVIGEAHQDLLKNMNIKQKVYCAEINLELLLTKQKQEQKMQPICSFPSSQRDWTITVSKNLSVEKIFCAIASLSSITLQNIDLINIYESNELGKDNRNLSFRFVYQDFKKTLSFEEVEEEHHRILSKILESLKSYI